MTGDLSVNDFFEITPRPEPGQRFSRLRGILRYANGNFKLEPRDADDVASVASLLSLEPPMTVVRSGAAVTLTAVLTGPAAGDLDVDLVSSSSGTPAPPFVVIPSGADRASFSVNAGAAGIVAVTATLEGVSRTATISIYDDATVRAVTELTVATTTLRANASTTARVALNAPGVTGGSIVSLEVDPAVLVVIPSTVVVLEGASDATFSLTAGASDGTGTLTARLGASSASQSLTVRSTVTRAPAAGDLVITEIHYNPTNPTTGPEAQREWFEVMNASTDSLTIDGLVIRDATSNQAIAAAGAELAPGAYGIFAYGSNAAQNGITAPIAVYGTSGAVQLNNSGDTLVIELGGVEIDRVVYSSSWGGANGASLCLKAPYAADNNAAAAWSTSVGAFGPNNDQGSPGLPSDGTNCP